jgi:hypothetical protein
MVPYLEIIMIKIEYDNKRSSLSDIVCYGKIADGYNGHTVSVVITKWQGKHQVNTKGGYWYSIPLDCSLPVFV